MTADPRRRRQMMDLTAEKLEQCWEALGGLLSPDVEGLQSTLRLATVSEQVVPFLRERVKPAVDQVSMAEERRGVDAVWVLEMIGNPEARAVLEGLASGAPKVGLTRAAAAALKRLKERSR
jgi:hypothetical protein